MKKIIALIALFGIIGFSSCDKINENPTPLTQQNEITSLQKSISITEDLTPANSVFQGNFYEKIIRDVVSLDTTIIYDKTIPSTGKYDYLTGNLYINPTYVNVDQTSAKFHEFMHKLIQHKFPPNPSGYSSAYDFLYRRFTEEVYICIYQQAYLFSTGENFPTDSEIDAEFVQVALRNFNLSSVLREDYVEFYTATKNNNIYFDGTSKNGAPAEDIIESLLTEYPIKYSNISRVGSPDNLSLDTSYINIGIRNIINEGIKISSGHVGIDDLNETFIRLKSQNSR